MHKVRHKSRLLPALAVSAAGFATAACTTVTTQSFRAADSPNVKAAYLATDADFGKYDRLTAEEMGIFFPDDSAPSLPDQQRTRQIFREAFLGELNDYQFHRGHRYAECDRVTSFCFLELGIKVKTIIKFFTMPI